jgi:hypothetical protein
LVIGVIYARRDLWFKIDTTLLVQQLKGGFPFGVTGVLTKVSFEYLENVKTEENTGAV